MLFMIVKIIVYQINLLIHYREHNYSFMYLVFTNSIIIVRKGGVTIRKIKELSE
jgi:hypothetical protein